MDNLGPKLSDVYSSEQIEALRTEMVPFSQATPVRFQHHGQTLSIQSGHLQPRGINVIHQTVYWNFTKETAKKVAVALNVKLVFSE